MCVVVVFLCRLTGHSFVASFFSSFCAFRARILRRLCAEVSSKLSATSPAHTARGGVGLNRASAPCSLWIVGCGFRRTADDERKQLLVLTLRRHKRVVRSFASLRPAGRREATTGVYIAIIRAQITQVLEPVSCLCSTRRATIAPSLALVI